jgi:hypothetical protein
LRDDVTFSLVEHPNAVVRKIAVEMVKRKGRGVKAKG